MIDIIINKIVLMGQSFANFVAQLPLWIKIATMIVILLIVIIIASNVVKKRKMRRIQAEKSRKMAMLDKSISNDRKEEQI